MDITNLDILLPQERKEISDLLTEFEHYRSIGDYAKSDKARALLQEWDNALHITKIWLPHFESSEHRQERAFNRMKQYNISVYPWSLEDLK